MKRVVYKKRDFTPVPVTLPERLRRRKIPIDTMAAVFKLYNEKLKAINLLYDAFDNSEEKMNAQSNALESLLKRLGDFNLTHRFDVAGARRDIANQRYRT